MSLDYRAVQTARTNASGGACRCDTTRHASSSCYLQELVPSPAFVIWAGYAWQSKIYLRVSSTAQSMACFISCTTSVSDDHCCYALKEKLAAWSASCLSSFLATALLLFTISLLVTRIIAYHNLHPSFPMFDPPFRLSSTSSIVFTISNQYH